MYRRFYHSTCILNNLKKQGIKLSKMLNPKNKKRWYPTETLETNSLPSIKSLTKINNEPGKRGVRRVAMLNKLFMKNITDILSTGTVSLKVVGQGIEISKVKISPNLQTINVFWVCKGDASDVQTEALLQSVAGSLRHELSTLRLMGEVPYIIFVKDRQESQTVDLDRRLAIADYGEDYTPTEIGHLLKTDFTLNTKLSPEMKTKIKQLEEQVYLIEDPLPEMTQNVYGLDHAKILNRLLGARKKTRDAWDSIKADAPAITYRSELKVSNIDVGKQKKDISEFLLQRQVRAVAIRVLGCDWLLFGCDCYLTNHSQELVSRLHENYQRFVLSKLILGVQILKNKLERDNKNEHKNLEVPFVAEEEQQCYEEDVYEDDEYEYDDFDSDNEKKT